MELLLLREGRSFTVYSLETGDSVADFLGELEQSNQAEFARMMRRLEQLADRGPSRRRTEFNDLNNGLYEAKAKGGGRVVFFYDAGRIVICACGFAKKSRKTPASMLKVAAKRRRGYERHKDAGQDFRVLVPEGMDEPRRMP